MNFLKNSIFSRGAGDSSPDWEPENENQMLAVWGSPGSGKTTTAVKLAARLAMQKKDVALLLCDMNTPMLPCTENRVEDGKFVIVGHHRQINPISDSLARRLMENGMPQETLAGLLNVKKDREGENG